MSCERLTDVETDEIPELTTDLYRLYDAEGTLLYIGISKSAMARMKQHAKEKEWWLEVRRIEIEHVLGGRCDAELAERRAIESERPKYNITYNTPRYLKLPTEQQQMTAAQLAERAREKMEHFANVERRKQEQLRIVKAELERERDRERERAREAEREAERLLEEIERLERLIEMVRHQIIESREELMALL